MLRTGASRNEAGFTLLELLVVIALMSIATLAGIILLPEIGDRLVVARATAQIEQMLSGLAAEASATGYDRALVLKRGDAPRNFLLVGESRELDPEVRIDWIAATETGSDTERGVVTFFGAGGASGGKLVLSRGAARATLEIDWLTGRIRTEW